MRLCGIDEAGRGCIAGDLAVAGVILNSKIKGLNDSKKLSRTKRDELSLEIMENSDFHVVVIESAQIDKIGISESIAMALREIMQTLDADKYLFDGNSTFGVKGIKTLVKADTKVEEVKAASIIAKTTRDDNLDALDESYDKYEFASLKGYGTAKHIQLIKKYGYSDQHRLSFNTKGLEGIVKSINI